MSCQNVVNFCQQKGCISFQYLWHILNISLEKEDGTKSASDAYANIFFPNPISL